MTEVDSVIPENVSISAQSQPHSSETIELNTTTTSTSNGTLLLTDQLNGGNNKELAVQAESSLHVNAPETDEDDSQITSSSTENGIGSKTTENTAKHAPQQSSTENSTESLSETDIASNKDKQDKLESLSKSNSSSSNEDSSNGCDSISQNRDSIDNKSSHDELTITSADKKESDKNTAGVLDKNNKCVDNHTAAAENNSLSDAVVASSRDHSSADAKTNSRNEDNEENLLVEAKSNKSTTDVAVADESMDTAVDPLHAVHKITEKSSLGLENGATSDVDKDDTGIVDLGDDSDEEMEEESVSNKPQKLIIEGVDSNSVVNLSMNKAKSICSDSDGAVVIGSDSENELDQPSPIKQKPAEPKIVSPQEIVDDDDDDCVVIEDDGPIPMHVDVSKRKSMLNDSTLTTDDSQPPSKRQRTSMPPTTTNQITIKDARSLMPQELPGGGIEISDASGVFPINIRPAASVQGPPKLVPVSNTTNATLSTLPALNSSTNLLPGLTDDMYVLEAPSFIVPYIYEKPPTDNLREVVREIEAKYELTKEDLADADKSDEFDMMTEQNKEEKEEKGGKKKKRRRGAEEPDESWSEESEEDEEEDDDSDSGMRTKVLIKEANDDLSALKGAIKPAAAVAGVTIAAAVPNANTPNKPGLENYFESPLGKFFMNIGVGQVQEFVQTDLIRLQKRKMRKSLGKNIMEFERAIAALSGNLEASKKKNSAFRFTMKRCEFCNFKSESALSMANHYETPHMNGPLYKCNFCIFEIRNANEIVYHMEAVHNIKARLVKPLPYHQCPNCGFEDNGKAKLGRHQPVCAKKFRPEINLAPPHDWEAPAKIPRIKPRHGLVGTATAYQAMAAQAAAQKAALASIQQQQQQAAQARSLQAAAIAAQNAANKIRGRSPAIPNKGPNTGGAVIRSPNQVRSPMATNVVMPNNYQLAGAQLIQNANAMAKKTLSGQPSISITPLPRQSGSAQASSASSSKMPPAGMKPGQSPSGNKAQFVICEICDGYIKDLEQLRNHMQWMHKVKIHPKMIYNRPPLNCQKCQFRFFTDQGLERHLLGSHGLVTSSMQEAANKGKDAGRCPVCGRLYQWKLLNHVSRDHHMTLKPAHLSYKCTVCTATFGMYKQFETHVYTAHSTVAKKAMDGKKNNTPTSSTISIGNQRSSLSATNDSLLKPLKINDEITIIPQPASKSRITNMESHVID